MGPLKVVGVRNRVGSNHEHSNGETSTDVVSGTVDFSMYSTYVESFCLFVLCLFFLPLSVLNAHPCCTSTNLRRVVCFVGVGVNKFCPCCCFFFCCWHRGGGRGDCRSMTKPNGITKWSYTLHLQAAGLFITVGDPF